MTARWTTPDDVAAKMRRRWTDGSLLRAHAEGSAFAEVDVPLRGPKPSEIGDDLPAVRAWVDRLEAGSRGGRRFTLVHTTVGGRHIGRNRLPARAVVSTFDQAWALLGVEADVHRFVEILALADSVPAARTWALARPLAAIDLREDWPRLLAAVTWLDENRGSGSYLREISARGVDTKYAEQHRSTLAAILGVSATASGFLTGLGLRTRPELIRLRVSPTLGLPAPLTELALRATELAALPLAPRSALICENEVTYLSVPVPTDGVVLWGKGFEVDRVGRLPWLGSVPVTYWGDLDTHGFAILDRLRAWLPQVRSVLMDRETLLTHRDRWGTEPTPATSRLTRLTREEHEVYADLVADRFGERVRLEQERIDWAWAMQRLR